MQLRHLNSGSDSLDWDKKWESIFDHYQRDLRHAHYIRAILEPGEKRVLEIGAGSFRDTAELRRQGIFCEGMDFSAESVVRAKRQFPQYASGIHHMSAFAMPFEDNAFDISFHNGFWVLFEDEQIRSLAVEQARISRKRMIATVHNAHNKRFVQYFDAMKEKDPLYDIRFFEVDEIAELMGAVCKDVTVIPVGKYKRRHEDMLIRFGLTSPRLIRPYLKLSGQRLLDRSERLMCIGTSG